MEPASARDDIQLQGTLAELELQQANNSTPCRVIGSYEPTRCKV